MSYLEMLDRAEKCLAEPGDAHAVGARCTVVSRVGPVDEPGHEFHGQFGYFVLWDDLPNVPVFVLSHKIRRVEG